MKKKVTWRKMLKSAYRYFVFFTMIAFVVTCCMMLFVSVMRDSLNLVLTKENLKLAAKLTFYNVLLLGVICTIIDAVRRKILIEKPVKKITDAAEKVMQGDFSVKIDTVSDDAINRVVECFNNLTKELSGTETLRTDFIANVSHEIKTPLSVISNYATLLQGDVTEEERKEYTSAIIVSAKRLNELTANVLKLSKLENQQIFPEKKKYNLGEQLCECLLGFENQWEEKEIEIETAIEEDVFIEADSELMSIVWNNLFSNAFKFTPSMGKVTIKLETKENYAVVCVEDTGCGIDKEAGKRIFDKFYQGDKSRLTNGNGLGLALVKRVVDITGGEIEVVSEIGKGSTFSVKVRRI